MSRSNKYTEGSTSSVQTARTAQDELPAADDTESEYTKGCQDPFDGQDPYNRATKLLATVCGSELEHNDAMDSSPKEDTNIMSAPQPATAAVICQESVTTMDGQSATLRSPLVIPAPDDPEIPEQAVEVANNKQEWEICDIVGKEDVDGVPHYWVQWSVTLVPKSEMGKARALVARFEAGLRAQRKQKGGKGRGRLLPSKAGKRAAAGVRTTGQTQQKGRGRPRKEAGVRPAIAEVNYTRYRPVT
jgi:hypothetical protein